MLGRRQIMPCDITHVKYLYLGPQHTTINWEFLRVHKHELLKTTENSSRKHLVFTTRVIAQKHRRGHSGLNWRHRSPMLHIHYMVYLLHYEWCRWKARLNKEIPEIHNVPKVSLGSYYMDFLKGSIASNSL